jgi:hypothetical protein
MNKITKWLLLAVFLGQSVVFASPLHDAAAKGDLKEVTELINNGAPVNESDSYKIHGISMKVTPLNLALIVERNPNLRVIQKLIDAGANVNIAESLGGRTPLHVATDNGNLSVIKALVDGRADIKARTNSHRSVLDIAAYKVVDYANYEQQQGNYLNILTYLLDAGADINDKDGEGRTVLSKVDGILRFSASKASFKGVGDAITAIRRWSIIKQFKITDPKDIEILDIGVPGSYHRAFKARAEKAARESEVVGPEDEPVGPGEE